MIINDRDLSLSPCLSGQFFFSNRVSLLDFPYYRFELLILCDVTQ
jgi:hypothetical protein